MSLDAAAASAQRHSSFFAATILPPLSPLPLRRRRRLLLPPSPQNTLVAASKLRLSCWSHIGETGELGFGARSHTVFAHVGCGSDRCQACLLADVPADCTVDGTVVLETSPSILKALPPQVYMVQQPRC